MEEPARGGKRQLFSAAKNWRKPGTRPVTTTTELLGSRVKSHVMCKFRREFVDRSNVGCHLEL